MPPPDGIAMVLPKSPEMEETSMDEISILGVGLAKHVFQVHGDMCSRSMVRRLIEAYCSARSFPGHSSLDLSNGFPRCGVAMEACGTAYHGGPGCSCSGTRFGLSGRFT